MNKNCIISVANGGYYPQCLDRMKKSLERVGYTGGILTWINSYPPNSPDHKTIPYAFKPYAFKEAIRQGYQNILWLDSAVWAIDKIDVLWKEIEDVGYLFFTNYGYNTGEWCSDECLKSMNKTREESFKYPHLMACCMGLNFSNPVCRDFLDQWIKYADDGVTFPGPWSNDNNNASSNSKVRGHRHDQTVASFLVWDLGMREWQDMGSFNDPPAYLLYYSNEFNPEDISTKTVLLSRGGVTPGELDKTVRSGI